MQPHIFRMVHREKGKGEAIIGQKVKILALLCSVLLLKSFIRCQVYCLIGHQPTQYSCLENRIDRGAWWAMVQGAAESQTQLGRSWMRSTLLNASWRAPSSEVASGPPSLRPATSVAGRVGQAGLWLSYDGSCETLVPSDAPSCRGKEMTRETSRILRALTSLLPAAPLPVCTMWLQAPGRDAWAQGGLAQVRAFRISQESGPRTQCVGGGGECVLSRSAVDLCDHVDCCLQAPLRLQPRKRNASAFADDPGSAWQSWTL